ncbi:hypothetical protein S245_016208, partial [Arachis hypogaea]
YDRRELLCLQISCCLLQRTEFLNSKIEAARKSRLRKKAYVQQLENSRVRLAQLEQELQSPNFKNRLTDPAGVLQSWDSTLVNPCTWFYVTCSNDNSVIRVFKDLHPSLDWCPETGWTVPMPT